MGHGENERVLTTLASNPPVETDAPEGGLRWIVAREGAELASVLRSRGWSARAGWKGVGDDGRPVWFVRFECPGGEASQ